MVPNSSTDSSLMEADLTLYNNMMETFSEADLLIVEAMRRKTTLLFSPQPELQAMMQGEIELAPMVTTDDQICEKHQLKNMFHRRPTDCIEKMIPHHIYYHRTLAR